MRWSMTRGAVVGELLSYRYDLCHIYLLQWIFFYPIIVRSPAINDIKNPILIAMWCSVVSQCGVGYMSVVHVWWTCVIIFSVQSASVIRTKKTWRGWEIHDSCVLHVNVLSCVGLIQVDVQFSKQASIISSAPVPQSAPRTANSAFNTKKAHLQLFKLAEGLYCGAEEFFQSMITNCGFSKPANCFISSKKEGKKTEPSP